MEKRNTRFGNRLRELREEAGLSMIQLAAAIGVSDAAVCKWENGLAEPKVSYIIKLAEYFDCSTDYLMGNDGYYHSRAAVTVRGADGKAISPHIAAVNVEADSELRLKPNERKLLKSFRNLSSDRKTLLQQTAEAWSGSDGKND